MSYEEFWPSQIGDHVQIRVVGCAQAIGVGIMLMDGADMISKKGKAVQVLQLYGDHLWEMGSKREIEFNRNDHGDQNVDDEKDGSGLDGDLEEVGAQITLAR